jgi:hypothetical protein
MAGTSTRRNVMALFERKENKYYCKVVWMEAGKSVTRRLTQLSIVTATGLVYHISGKDLPDTLIIQTGPTVGGNPTADVLLKPKSRRLEQALGWAPKNARPTPRDIMLIGGTLAALGGFRLLWYVSQFSQ